MSSSKDLVDKKTYKDDDDDEEEDEDDIDDDEEKYHATLNLHQQCKNFVFFFLPLRV